MQGLEDYGRDVRLAQDLERSTELPDIAGTKSLTDAPLQIGGGHPASVRLIAEPSEVEGSCAAGGRGRVGSVVDGDDHLRPRGVGEEGPVGRRDLLVPAPGQEDFSGRQDLGQLLGHGEVQVRLGEPSRALVSCIPAAVGGIDDYGPGKEVIGEVPSALVRKLVGSEGLCGEGVQNLEDRRVHHPVVLQACVPLEVANGPDGTWVEQAVDGAGVEPKVVEHLLEFDDVSASKRRLPEVEQASSGPVTSLHYLAPRDGTDKTVSEETEALLEGPYGELRALPENAVYAPASQVEAECLQAGLEVDDLSPPVSSTQRTHVPDRSPLFPRSDVEPAKAC